MKRRSGLSARRAVRNMLSRLGMQAKPAEVVAALARQGIEVGEELVRLVRFDLLKGADRRCARPAHTPGHTFCPPFRHRTTPAPRGRR